MNRTTEMNNEIYIKTSIDYWILMRSLAQYIDVEDTSKIGRVISADQFYLKLYDNRHNNGPDYYDDLNIEDDFFTHFVDCDLQLGDVQANIDLLAKILQFFWDQGIPAATRFNDFNHLLPLQGGNDTNQIFWFKNDSSGEE